MRIFIAWLMFEAGYSRTMPYPLASPNGEAKGFND